MIISEDFIVTAAMSLNCDFIVKFDGVMVSSTPESDLGVIYSRWRREHSEPFLQLIVAATKYFEYDRAKKEGMKLIGRSQSMKAYEAVD